MSAKAAPLEVVNDPPGAFVSGHAYSGYLEKHGGVTQPGKQQPLRDRGFAS
jgi:hypothetical protein